MKGDGVAGEPRPIRILRLFSRLNIGGPSVHVILLSAGLRDRGYQTRLVIGQEEPREGNLLGFAEEKGVACTQLAGLGREIRLLADLRTLARLRRMIREYRPAIVHTHTAKAGALGRLAARLAGVPIVVHTYHGHVLQGYFGAAGSALVRGAERLLSPLSDTLLAVSEAVKRELVEMGVARASKIRVIPLGLDLEPLAARLPRGILRCEAGFPEDAPLIGVVGRLVPIKDIGSFLEAAALVRNSFPTSRFAIVGDGQERDLLEARVPSLGLSGFVRFYGWRRDMASIYGDLDVVVNASRNEGTPVSLIEALAAGRPVVATRVGGTPDLVGDDRGLLVPPGDPAALAAGILECLRNPEAATARARAGQRHVLRHHAIGRLLDDMDGLYRELLAGRAGAA